MRKANAEDFTTSKSAVAWDGREITMEKVQERAIKKEGRKGRQPSSLSICQRKRQPAKPFVGPIAAKGVQEKSQEAARIRPRQHERKR